MECENSCAAEAAKAAAVASADSAIRLQGWRRRAELACDAVKQARRAEAELAKATTLINATERMLEAAEADVAKARARADKAIDVDAKRRLLEAFHLNTLGPDALLDLVLDLARETQAATQLKRLARLANGLPEHDPPAQQEPSSDEVMPSSSTEEAVEEAIEEDESSFYSPEIAAHAELAAFLTGGGYNPEHMPAYDDDIPVDVHSGDEEYAYADDDDDGYGDAAAGDSTQNGEEDALNPARYRRRDSEVLSSRERSALRKLNNRVDKLRSKLDKKQSKMDKAKVNVGEGEAFANLPADRALLALSEKCLKYRSKTYMYEICFFAKAKQGSTRLGTFRRLETAGSQLSALFDNGDRCYKGPPRSLRVNFVCGVEDTVRDVNEPETCVYVATVATPTVCEIDDLDLKVSEESARESFTCDDRREFSLFRPLYEVLNVKISLIASWFRQ